MNAFTKASKKERDVLLALFQKNNVTKYEFTDPEGFDRHDAEFEMNGKTYLVEIKNRNVKSNAFKTTLIEESKVKYLVDKAKAENKIPLLLITFTDGMFAQFNLSTCLKPKYLTTRDCNRTTAVSSQKITKDVYLIPIDNVKVIGVTTIL